jgi:hypothetical protein
MSKNSHFHIRLHYHPIALHANFSYYSVQIMTQMNGHLFFHLTHDKEMDQADNGVSGRNTSSNIKNSRRVFGICGIHTTINRYYKLKYKHCVLPTFASGNFV